MLRINAGLTVRGVARKCGIPPATLGGYFSGRHLPPLSQLEAFRAVIAALGVPAEQSDAWRMAVARLRRQGSVERLPSPYRGMEGYGVTDQDLFFGRETLSEGICQWARDAAIRPSGPRVMALVGISGSGKSSLLRAGVIGTLMREGWNILLTAPGQAPIEALDHALAEAPAFPDQRRLLAIDQFEEIFAPDVSAETRVEVLERLTTIASEDAEVPTVVLVALRADFYAQAVGEPLLMPHLRENQVLVGPMEPGEIRRAITEPAASVGAAVEPALVEVLLRDLRATGSHLVDSALPLLSHALVATWSRSRGSTLTVADYLAAGGIAGAVQSSAEQVYDGLSEAGQQQARTLFAHLVSVDEEGRAMRRRVAHAELADGSGLSEIAGGFLRARILTATETTLEISHDVLLGAWPRLHEWIEDDRAALRIRRRVSLAAATWEQEDNGTDGLLRGAALELARQLPASGVRLTAVEQKLIDASVAEEAAKTARARGQRRRITVLAAVATVLAVLATTLSVYLIGAVAAAHRDQDRADDARLFALSNDVAVESGQLAQTEPALAAQLAVIAARLSNTMTARSAVLNTTGSVLVTRLLGTPGAMRATASPDGGLIATVSADGRARFFQRTGQRLTQLSARTIGKGAALFASAFSPDGRLFAAAGVGGVVTVLDLRDPAHPSVWGMLTGPRSAVQALAFSPDGRFLIAAASDPGLFRWRLRRNGAARLPTITDFTAGLQSIAVSSDGVRVATGTADGHVGIWSAHGANLTPVAAANLESSTDAINALAFSPDGRTLAAGARDEGVHLWTLRPRGQALRLKPLPTLDGFTSWVNDVVFSADGSQLAAVASGARGAVWRTADWHAVTTFTGTANYTSVAFVPGSHLLLTAAIDGVTRLRPLVGPRLDDFGDTVGASAQTGDGRTLWVGPGSANPVVAQVRREGPLQYSETGLVLHAPSLAGRIDQSVAVSPDGTELVAGTNTGHLVIWHVTGSHADLVGTLVASAALVEQVAFSPDGRYFAAATDDGTVTIYPGRTGTLPSPVATLHDKGMDLQLAFAPNSTMLAVAAANDVVHLWTHSSSGSAEQWSRLSDLTGFGSYVYGVAFSPDGRTLAAGGADKKLRLYRIRGNRLSLTQVLAGPENTVHWLDFGPSGAILAAADQDGSVWLWRMRDGVAMPYATMGTLGAEAYTVQMDRGAGEVIATGASGLFDSWATDVKAAVKAICATAGTPITRAEWKQYVPGEPYDPPCS